jgi:hypothetical protein
VSLGARDAGTELDLTFEIFKGRVGREGDRRDLLSLGASGGDRLRLTARASEEG